MSSVNARTCRNYAKTLQEPPHDRAVDDDAAGGERGALRGPVKSDDGPVIGEPLDGAEVRLQRALIDGHLGNYALHLGSAVVHKMPGGALCIVSVPAQHRGRIFLPFADNDPRTAEVLAKLLLLARDDEIQDPSILEQLRR